jgi:hypothetical protein
MNENFDDAEDLTLESTDSDAVKGGRVNVDPGDERAYVLASELAAWTAKGYTQDSCTTEGALMVNKAGDKKLLRFV